MKLIKLNICFLLIFLLLGNRIIAQDLPKFTEEKKEKPAPKADHTAPAKPHIDEAKIREQREAEQQRKIEEKRKMEEKYLSTLIEADNAFDHQDYSNAKKLYLQSQNYGPSSSKITERLTRIKESMDSIKTENLNEKYQALIRQADDAFSKQNFADAKSMYIQSQTLNQSDTHPAEMLTRIKASLDSIQTVRNEEKARDLEIKRINNQYASLIETGKKFYQKKEYENAQKSFMEAGTLKPAEEEARTLLDGVNKRMQEIKDSIDTENKYEAKITYADSLLNIAGKGKDTSAFNLAGTAFNEALQIKTNETFPLKQLKYINSEINRLVVDKARQDSIALYNKTLDTYNSLRTKYYGLANIEANYEEQISLLDEIVRLQGVLNIPVNKDFVDLADKRRSFLQRKKAAEGK